MSETMWTGLAVDLGASSGRVLAGKYNGKQLTLEEIHRFANEPVTVRGTMYWDILRLYQDMKHGIMKAGAMEAANQEELVSIGIDSWAVDFGLLDCNGDLIGNPVHYRDKRTDGIMEKVLKRIPKQDIFHETGVQFLPFNTIYQLVALQESGVLNQAETLLLIPDLLTYFLTGEKLTEYTNATTTQLYNPITVNWSGVLLEQLNIPRRVFAPVVQPGTVIGPMRPDVTTGLLGTKLEVMAVASHDTGSAVAAVPAKKEKFAYLSSGTWSLLGMEVKQPVMTDQALALNFTNEGGIDGTYRLLKNIMGLWLLQEMQKEWQRYGKKLSWEEMTHETRRGTPFVSFIDPDDPMFLPPGDMSGRVRDYCRKSGQLVPDSEANLLRCVTESLALKYRYVLDELEELTGEAIETLHIVGGGVQNELLCQWTANAIQRKVVAGPVEASSYGNILVQLIGLREISDIVEGRELIAQSVATKTYEPENEEQWETAFELFKEKVFRSG